MTTARNLHESRPRGFYPVMITSYIKNKFGSKRGLMRAFFCELARYGGFFRRLKKIDFQKVDRLVFICNGNICRSPLGEAVAKAQGVSSCSYGLDTRGDDNADPRAIAFAITYDIVLDNHKTQKIEKYIPSPNDLLVGMEPKHASTLVALYGNKVQITLAGLWLKKPIAYLHDPYNTNETFFNRCETLVVQSAQNLTKKVIHAK